MAKMHYIIDKAKGYVTAQHETRELCQQHIDNSTSLFGGNPDDLIIAEGAKERDAVLKSIR